MRGPTSRSSSASCRCGSPQRLSDTRAAPGRSGLWRSSEGGRSSVPLCHRPAIYIPHCPRHPVRLVGFRGWASGLEAAGVRTRLSRGPLRINDSAAVLQAVAEGHGIAMARSVMASDGLAAGRLVRLFSAVECRSRLSYYMGSTAPNEPASCWRRQPGRSLAGPPWRGGSAQLGQGHRQHLADRYRAEAELPACQVLEGRLGELVPPARPHGRVCQPGLQHGQEAGLIFQEGVHAAARPPPVPVGRLDEMLAGPDVIGRHPPVQQRLDGQAGQMRHGQHIQRIVLRLGRSRLPFIGADQILEVRQGESMQEIQRRRVKHALLTLPQIIQREFERDVRHRASRQQVEDAGQEVQEFLARMTIERGVHKVRVEEPGAHFAQRQRAHQGLELVVPPRPAMVAQPLRTGQGAKDLVGLFRGLGHGLLVRIQGMGRASE
ncbi:hypothetical protein H5407_21155 [Mitsuaria sp. WAJ17]|nr:hypothetical protein [Mitsuaria sp. WAJ17]